MIKYRIGDKVKIVNKWPEGEYFNAEGEMDKWLGQVMTIIRINDLGGLIYYEMQEDQGECEGLGWGWFPNMIEGLVEQEGECG